MKSINLMNSIFVTLWILFIWLNFNVFVSNGINSNALFFENLTSSSTEEKTSDMAKCIYEITTKLFNNPILITISMAPETNEILKIILRRYFSSMKDDRPMEVKFIDGKSSVRTISKIEESYLILVDSVTSLPHLLDNLKTYDFFTARAKFLIVNTEDNFNHDSEWQMRGMIFNTWRKLMFKLVLLFYNNQTKNTVVYTHAYFARNVSYCELHLMPFELASNCDDLSIISDVFNSTWDRDMLDDCTYEILTTKCDPIVINSTSDNAPGM